MPNVKYINLEAVGIMKRENLIHCSEQGRLYERGALVARHWLFQQTFLGGLVSAWHDAGCSTVRGKEASGAGRDVQRNSWATM